MMHLTQQQLEQRYQDIFELYNHAEELLATVESNFVANPEAQIAVVEPLVAQVGESADVLTEIFLDAARGDVPAVNRKKAEMALRKLYIAIEEYGNRVRNAQKQAVAVLHNIADPIVARIKRQAERVVAIFMEMLSISVHLIMSKHEIERLKQHEARVALMLHGMSQQHS